MELKRGQLPGIVPPVRDWTWWGVSMGLAVGAAAALLWFVLFEVIAKFPAVE